VLLVSHDRYLIRNTVEELVAVRDGKVVHHHEMDEAVLSPGSASLIPSSNTTRSAVSAGKGSGSGAAGYSGSKSRSGRGGSGGGSGPATSPGRNGSSGPKGKQQRREEADKRNAKARNTRDLRKNVSRLERKAGDADAKVKALEVQLADPEIYADKALMNDLIDQHETAKRRADRLLLEWEEATTALERAENRG
jgi:ATP-binding cassette subfamily F protein 3